MDATVARPPIGQLLDGRYRVDSHLADGGMATVYLGTDTRLERTVALKIMHAELAIDEDFVRRFVAEARSVARLSHPNVVAVYDQGADGRTLYLAMEYVPGRTLRQALRARGRFSPAEALDIMDGALGGLAAAHAAGIAHRDVKPENVLLGDGLTVKVADFGLARLLSGARYTRSGLIIGTAAYLAPEQVSGGAADARTDVYAAGVMFFELLTGTQPHTGDSALAVAYKHVNEVVPAPSSVLPGLPPALDALVALATSRDPDLRPSDAGQYLHAIAGVRHGLPLAGSPPIAPAAGPPADETVPPGSGMAPVWRESPAGWPGPLPRPGTQPPGRDVQPPRCGPQPARPGTPPAWPGVPPVRPGGSHDLVPGMAPPPARQTFGGPGGGPPRPGGTQQFRDDPPGTHRTLIVSEDGGTAYGPPPPSYPAYPVAGEPRLQRLLFGRRLGYLAMTLAVLLVAGLLSWWLAAGRYATVPQVGGMTAAAARTDLRNAGLTTVTGKTQLDNHVGKGDVIRTIPAAGAKVGRGGRVTLILSAGPRMISMPQVTGQQISAAAGAIHQAGLVLGTVQHQTSVTIPAGIVISTNPPAGTSWPQPKPVVLVVSAGPPVPNFVGAQKSVAEQWASANGVSLDERTAGRSLQPAGTVIKQNVPPGSAFTKGQVIIIVISPGPPMVPVPSVNGMPVGRATRVLERAGFHVSVQGFPLFSTVVDYNPKGTAPKGSTIMLVVGPGG